MLNELKIHKRLHAVEACFRKIITCAPVLLYRELLSSHEFSKWLDAKIRRNITTIMLLFQKDIACENNIPQAICSWIYMKCKFLCAWEIACLWLNNTNSNWNVSVFYLLQNGIACCVSSILDSFWVNNNQMCLYFIFCKMELHAMWPGIGLFQDKLH